MILRELQLIKALSQPLTQSVFYYYSTEEYAPRRYAEKTIAILQQAEPSELTQIDGPAPSIEEIVDAAGTISMFGTRRIVAVSLEPSAMNDADVAELCDICESLENSVIVMTTIFKDGKAQLTKKSKLLIAAAEKNGIAAELTKPTPADAARFVVETAQKSGASVSKQAASAIVERSGTDFFVLENETAKLAASCNYGEITLPLIEKLSTHNIEANVFDMVRLVTSRRTEKAVERLNELIDLQNEPIAIAAALSGSFLDAYRVKCAQATGKNYSAAFKDFGYKGSDYRLKKAGESASGYTKKQLLQILEILLQLDTKLKSTRADKTALLQTALCEISFAGASR